MSDADVNKPENIEITKYDKWSKEDLIKHITKLECSQTEKLQEIKLRKKYKTREFKWENISKRHILLKFMYFGWDYHGFACQVDNTETIEEHLMAALKRCCLIKERETSNYHRCGRTDAGVSAFSQVISIDVRSKLKEPTEENTADELDYCKMLNRLLPTYIRCYSWAHVESDISARFDCTSRSYNYFFPKGNLNIAAMQTAAKLLEGTHDFRNLCKMDVNNGVVEFIRHVDAAEILPYSIGDNNEFQMMVFKLRSRAFLWHQIRCIMSVLLLVGEGHETPDIIDELFNIELHPRKPQYQLACPLPLALSAAEYENQNLRWNIMEEEKTIINGQLQALWTEFAIKELRPRCPDLLYCLYLLTVLRACLVREAMQTCQDNATWSRQVSLYFGVVPKTHVPLMSRHTCQSLEERIQTVERKKRKLNE